MVADAEQVAIIGTWSYFGLTMTGDSCKTRVETGDAFVESGKQIKSFRNILPEL